MKKIATGGQTLSQDFLVVQVLKKYDDISLETEEYTHVEFPDAFSAHWVRIRVDKATTATASFVYN